MYYCYEIPHYVYNSYDEVKKAVEGYPFKGGLCKNLCIKSEDANILKRIHSVRLTTDRLCALKDAQFQEFQF